MSIAHNKHSLDLGSNLAPGHFLFVQVYSLSECYLLLKQRQFWVYKSLNSFISFSRWISKFSHQFISIIRLLTGKTLRHCNAILFRSDWKENLLNSNNCSWEVALFIHNMQKTHPWKQHFSIFKKLNSHSHRKNLFHS